MYKFVSDIFRKQGNTPFGIFGVSENIKYTELRVRLREIIQDYKQQRISAEEFRCKYRAYETLSDFNKRTIYELSKQWIASVPLEQYSIQQLAAEPVLIDILRRRLRNANLSEINHKDIETQQTALYCAARTGNIAAVQFLIEQGAKLDLQQRTLSTALHAASFFGHPDVVRCLLENGANDQIINEGGRIAEMEAYNDVVRNVFIELKRVPYIRAAANDTEWFLGTNLVEHIDKQYYAQRQTLLHCACKKGYGQFVHLLVEIYGASLDIVDIHGNSALHLAACSNHEGIVGYLLNKGCDSTITNQWGLTAEQEGSTHSHQIMAVFESMRNKDMFEMARNGNNWWFQYYFHNNSPDTMDCNGLTLLHHACRHGQYAVAKWLLEHNADVNIQMRETPKNTALHIAKHYGHLNIIELLLEYDADIIIKNDLNETVFHRTFSEEVNQCTVKDINNLLLKFLKNRKTRKLIDIHIYVDDDKSDDPKVKLKVHHADTYDDLLKELPRFLIDEYEYFSFAGRPLNFENKNTKIISAVYAARHVSSKFIDTPLCLTLHRQPPNEYDNQQLQRENPTFNFTSFYEDFQTRSNIMIFELKPSPDKQTITVSDLQFTFSGHSIKDSIQFEVRTLFSIDYEKFNLRGCICLFETSLSENTNKLLELPHVSINGYQNVRLYTLAISTSNWFSCETRQTRLPMLDGIHAFIQQVSIIPNRLSLPIDMLIETTAKTPLTSREHPIKCTCLHLREHDPVNFPEVAYHSTCISFIRSILIDGLVNPGTIVSSGKRVNRRKDHISRDDDAIKIFGYDKSVCLSPNINYCCDSRYAVPFSYDDRQLLPVLECSIKKNAYIPVSGHASDGSNNNMEEVEWHVIDPTNIIINAVLFIPKVDSVTATKRERLAKLIYSSNST